MWYRFLLAVCNNCVVHAPFLLQINTMPLSPTWAPRSLEMTGALAMVNGWDQAQPNHPSEEDKTRMRTYCPGRQPELSIGISMRVASRDGMGRMVAVTIRVLSTRSTRSKPYIPTKVRIKGRVGLWCMYICKKVTSESHMVPVCEITYYWKSNRVTDHMRKSEKVVCSSSNEWQRE